MISVIVLFLMWSSGQLRASGPVYFADQNLKQAVEDTLGITDPDSVDMASLTYLNSYSNNITDLTGLEYANNLISLVLPGNKIEDITVIGHLSYLETLNLYSNPVSDITPLTTLQNLKILNLGNTQVNDIYPLWQLTQLEELVLQYTSVQNIIWLSDLGKLKRLDLYGADVTDITGLADLTDLEYLSMSSCPVEDISILGNMPKLNTLLLDGTAVRDISSLTQLTSLTSLNLQGTSLLLSGYCSHIATIEANNPEIELIYNLPPVGGDSSLNIDFYCDVDFASLLAYTNNWFYMPAFDQAPNGSIITVDDDGPADYSTIQEAINASTDGDVVKVMPGYYTGEGNYNLNFGAGLAAGQTRAITVCGSNANDPNIVIATIIDAQEKGCVFHFNSDEGPECIVAGLTITGGNAKYGAGIYCGSNTSPTISNCIITANTGLGFAVNSSMGGGIYYGGTGLINNCVIAYNYSDWDGGGIHVADEGELVLINCTFVRNSACSGGGCYLTNATGIMLNCSFLENESLGTSSHHGGGAIYTRGSNMELDECYFEGNKAIHGGAVRFSGNERKYVMRNCLFFDNLATEEGGAIYCEQGQYDFKDSIFADNSAEYGGAIYFRAYSYYYFYETGYLSRCWIYGNHASQDGGAVYLLGEREHIFWKEGDPWTEWCWIDNCEIKGNSADRYGGGIYIDYPDTMIRNCTMAGNTSIQGQGGAIYCAEETEPEIINNIITDNLGVAITVSDYAQPSISYNNFWNNIDGNHEGLGQIGAGNEYLDPQYEYPGWWEGDLSTPAGRRNARWFSGRFELSENSPCINAGENHWVRDWEADIDHNYRINDRIVDLGAHEFRKQLSNPEFTNGSDDLTDIPYFNSMPGDQRIFSGDSHYKDLQYRHEFSSKVLSFGEDKQIDCLRWEQINEFDAEDDGRALNIADFVVLLAKDVDGKLWLFGREENDQEEIVVEDLAHAVSFDDIFGIDAHLMSSRSDSPGTYVNAYYEIVDENGQFVVDYHTKEGFLQVKKLYSWSAYLGDQPTHAYYDQNKGLVAEYWSDISGPNPPFANWYLNDTQPSNQMDGYLTVDKCTVVANNDRSNPNDKLLVSLSEMDISSDNVSEASTAVLRLYNEDSLSPQKSYTFMVNGANANKFTNEYGAIRFNFAKETTKIAMKGIDLSGLVSPIKFEVEVGSYLESGSAYDGECLPIYHPNVPIEPVDQINGKKSMPMQLLSGYEDSLRVDKCIFKLGTKEPSTDSLTIRGAIAVADTSVDIAGEDVLVTWGDYEIPLPANVLYRIGSKKAFKYKKPKGTNSSIAVAIFDLEKCIFKIIVKKANISSQNNPVDFRIQFGEGTDEFDKTFIVPLTQKNASKFVYLK